MLWSRRGFSAASPHTHIGSIAASVAIPTSLYVYFRAPGGCSRSTRPRITSKRTQPCRDRQKSKLRRHARKHDGAIFRPSIRRLDHLPVGGPSPRPNRCFPCFRSEEHTTDLQSLIRHSYAVSYLK